MKSLIFKTTVVSVSLILAGCIDKPAGYVGSNTAFGNSNTNNAIAQSAYLRSSYLAGMSAKFRAAAPDTINFEFNKSTLTASARSNLDQQAAWIRANPMIKFRVYGHTDLVGSSGYNQALGLRRARAAVAYLVSRGVPRSKLDAVASFGKTRPLIDTSNPERLNRRTVTEVFGFASGYSGTDLDGKYAARVYDEYTQNDQIQITLSDAAGESGATDE